MSRQLFIGGMPKCGTTALSYWLVKQDLAENLILNKKDPAVYMDADFDPATLPPGSGRGLWRLDSTEVYALWPFALSRMPDNARMILCFRNPWDRVWSHYKMMKLRFSDDPRYRERGNYEYACALTSEVEERAIPERSLYQKGDFSSRLRHEQDALYAQDAFPPISILPSSQYRNALYNVLRKFPPQEVFPVNVRRLSGDAALRRRFVSQVLNEDRDTDPIEPMFVMQDLDIGEAKPDFSLAEFDVLRASMAYDLRQFEDVLTRRGLTTEFMDFDDLHRDVC